jgi:excisionase family DNA binding protein
MSALETAIKDVVKDALDEFLAPYTHRLREVEPLTYSVPDAAKVIGTSPHTVRRLLAEGRLPLIPHMGERKLIPRAAVQAFVTQSVQDLYGGDS